MLHYTFFKGRLSLVVQSGTLLKCNKKILTMYNNYNLGIINLICAYCSKIKKRKIKSHLQSLPLRDNYCQEVFGSVNKIGLNGKKEESLESMKPFMLSKTIKRCFDHQKNHRSLFIFTWCYRNHQNMSRKRHTARSLNFLASHILF